MVVFLGGSVGEGVRGAVKFSGFVGWNSRSMGLTFMLFLALFS